MKLKYKLLFASFSLIVLSYADNNELFNNAYQIGKQNQFNFNLNANSTINTYSANNKLESSYINNANAGTQNSKQDYAGASGDKNYLYNKATKDLAGCVNQNDPRCTTLNKYSDKDTQTTLQAYNHNVAQAYYIHTAPDPNDSNCTLITTKKPVNERTQQCIAAAHQQSTCTAKPIITINTNSYECNPNGGGCDKYKNNQLCTLVRNYVAPSCIAWSLNAHWFHHSGTFKKCHDDTVTRNCDINTVVENGDCRNHNQNFICDGKNPKGWNWQCTKYSPEQLAIYSCREPEYNYIDECASLI